MMNGHDPAPPDGELRELAADEGVPPDDALDALLAADVAAWRATLPVEEQFAARMEGMLRHADLRTHVSHGTVTTAEGESDEPDEEHLVREPLDEPDGGRLAIPRHISGRRGRGLLAAGAMAAVVAVLIVLIEVAAPLRGASVPMAPSQTITTRPPITLPGGAWQQVALPVASARWADYAISPSDAATIYACFSGAVPAVANGQVISGAISLWVTHDTGRHWSTIGLPLSGTASCQLSIARGASDRIGVLVDGTGSGPEACGNESIYLSDDSGARWHAVPYQAVFTTTALSPVCLLTVTSDALYIYSSWLTGEPISGGVQVSAWQRTTDGGQTWQRLDTAFGTQTLFMPWEVGTGDSFITSVIPMPGIHGGALWITHDGGTSWQRLGALPLGVGAFVRPATTPGLSEASASRPFYALAGEQIPSFLLRLAVYESGDGRTWAQLPPLPVPGATSQRTGMTDVLGVDASGRLYTLGVDPARGVPPPQSVPQELDQSRQWLWVWDPHVARWGVFPTPLDAPRPQLCGTPCWQGTITAGPSGASYLWVDVMGGDGAVTPALYRVVVR